MLRLDFGALSDKNYSTQSQPAAASTLLKFSVMLSRNDDHDNDTPNTSKLVL